MISRRAFLTGAGAILALPKRAAARHAGLSLLAAGIDRQGPALFGLQENGRTLFRLAMSETMRIGALHPGTAEAICFSTAANPQAVVVDHAQGRIRHRLLPPAGYRFTGRCCFLQDGRILLTPESNRGNGGHGQIGIWLCGAGYRRIGAFDSYGATPGEIMATGPDSLVVANAAPPPSRGRPSWRSGPSLAYLDSQGRLLDWLEFADAPRDGTISALALRGDGLLAFALRWPSGQGPLLGLQARGAPQARLVALPRSENLRARGIGGSLAFSGTGDTLAMLAPRSARLLLVSGRGQLERACPVPGMRRLVQDPGSDGFLGLDRRGQLWRVSRQGRLRPLEPTPARDLRGPLLRL